MSKTDNWPNCWRRMRIVAKKFWVLRETGPKIEQKLNKIFWVLGVVISNGLSICVRSCSWCHRQLRANSLCIESLARPRHVLFGAADHLPVGHRILAKVLYASMQCLMVGLHQLRPTGSESMRSCAAVFVAAYVHLIFRLKSSARQPTSSCSTKYWWTITTYFTVYSLHLQLHRRTIIWGLVFIIDN